MTERTFTAAQLEAKAETADLKARNETNPDQKQWYRDNAAMLRQGADAESRWEQLKADVGKTAADYVADIEINPYRSGQKAHAKAVLDEMARLEKERTA